MWIQENTKRDYNQKERSGGLQRAPGVMVKILGDADSSRRCAMDRFERVESSDWRGKIVHGFRRIQSNYSQIEYGKNFLVVGRRR